jgi:hypothetical protein
MFLQSLIHKEIVSVEYCEQKVYGDRKGILCFILY